MLSAPSPGTHLQAPEEAIATARDANDLLAETVAAQPDRFAGFALLLMRRLLPGPDRRQGGDPPSVTATR
ncbi:MAG: hypothetical protein M0007_07870 [Actinomycetota bacterium]|nr:hypothetical protein [Actinomycetota bacterium]